MCNDSIHTLSGLSITRGDTLMLYGMTKRNYSIRFEVRLDQPIDPAKMRVALDKTIRRYPYFSVTLKKNDKEYYYERNDAPVALLHTRKMTTLNSEESNGHIWAVCYDDDSLFVDFYHGRSDGTGVYFLISTLLYYYLVQQDSALDARGIRTLDTPITKSEVHDPQDDLPFVDVSSLKAPPAPAMINLMEASGLQRAQEKGVIMKLAIPEESFMSFSRENDATPGIMVSVLFARAVRRVHPDLPESIVGSYIANARPMLQANDTFHNCVTRVTLEYDARVQGFPLTKQCTVFRGKTFAQTYEKNIRAAMTIAASAAQTILDLPNIGMKAQVAEQVIARSNTTLSYTVSYVGKWKLPQLGEHIRGFWVNTTVGGTPIIQLSAVNGQLFLTIIQPFSERVYYDALLDELRDQGIPYTECGTEPNRSPDVAM